MCEDMHRRRSHDRKLTGYTVLIVLFIGNLSFKEAHNE